MGPKLANLCFQPGKLSLASSKIGKRVANLFVGHRLVATGCRSLQECPRSVYAHRMGSPCASRDVRDVHEAARWKDVGLVGEAEVDRGRQPVSQLASEVSYKLGVRDALD